MNENWIKWKWIKNPSYISYSNLWSFLLKFSFVKTTDHLVLKILITIKATELEFYCNVLKWYQTICLRPVSPCLELIYVKLRFYRGITSNATPQGTDWAVITVTLLPALVESPYRSATKNHSFNLGWTPGNFIIFRRYFQENHENHIRDQRHKDLRHLI